MSTQNQTAAEALVETRLRQLKKEIRAAQTAQRVRLRSAATYEREQLKAETKRIQKQIAAELKIAIKDSDSFIAARFRREAETAAKAKTLANSIARQDVKQGDKSLADFPPTYAEMAVAL